jgi:hypothetical protein
VHTADQIAIDALHGELGYEAEGPMRFAVRLSGVAGSFTAAVPVAVGALAFVAMALASVPVGFAIALIAVSLVHPTGGRVHGLRVADGHLFVEGVDARVPLQQIRSVRRTLTGLSFDREAEPPLDLQLTQRESALDWLAERIREAIIAHGEPADVPAALARLRGEATADLEGSDG